MLIFGFLTLFRRFIRPESTRVDSIQSHHVKVEVVSFSTHIKLLHSVQWSWSTVLRKFGLFRENHEKPLNYTTHLKQLKVIFVQTCYNFVTTIPRISVVACKNCLAWQFLHRFSMTIIFIFFKKTCFSYFFRQFCVCVYTKS